MPRLTPAGRTLGLLLLVLCTVSLGTAEAKTYVAERFDSRVELLEGGDLQVVETVVFRFDDGTFKEVFREIPSRNSDGVEFVSASMDGQVLPPGKGPGQVEVRGSRTVRIKWRFAPTRGSRHTFELVYVIRGAVRQEGDVDLLSWRALPGRHAYRIESSTIELSLPAAPSARGTTRQRKVERLDYSQDGSLVRVRAGGIRSNGWIELHVPLPRGSVIAAAPDWQQRQQFQRGLAPRWIAAAAAVFVAALILLFAVHQGYDRPPHDRTTAAGGPALPDSLAPAEAGAVLANGSPRLEHAMATLVALAGRGELVIAEEPRGRFGQRRFILTRRQAKRPLAPFEQAVIDTAFTPRGQTEEAVSLDKARSRLMHRLKPFSRAVRAELTAHGLIDEGRMAVRHRYMRIGIFFLVAAAVVVLPLALLTIPRFGPWPMLIPLALALGGLAAFIAQSAHTQLSNEGVRRARAWRGFERWLKDVTQDKATGPADHWDRLLAYAIALGLGGAWSKYLTRHRQPVPPWFRPAAGGDSSAAFVAFVAYGGAAGTGGGGAGAGGAAGGGASGAG